MIVGVAGKTCAGKDRIATWFHDRGFTVVDADAIGHQALKSNEAAVVARFGTLDRKELGAQVFANPQALADLEAITHPWIGDEIRRQVKGGGTNVVINAPLLHKQDLFRLCEVVVWVQAPLWVRLVRARRRDHWSWIRLLQRIWAQRKLTPQVFPSHVDILVVDNFGPSEEVRTRLETRFFPGTASAQKEDIHEKQ